MATAPSLGTSTAPATGDGSMPVLGASTLLATGNGTMGAAVAGMAAPLQLIVAHPFATVNIKSHVPITLELNSNYSKWAFFKSLCGKFGLRSHIDGSTPPQLADPQWDAMECCIRSWILSSVDDSVLDLTMDEPDLTARDLWVAIEEIFCANKEPHAIFLLTPWCRATPPSRRTVNA
jgi:hypothetical protein